MEGVKKFGSSGVKEFGSYLLKRQVSIDDLGVYTMKIERFEEIQARKMTRGLIRYLRADSAKKNVKHYGSLTCELANY